MKNNQFPGFKKSLFGILLCGVLVPVAAFAAAPTGSSNVSISAEPIKLMTAPGQTVVKWSSQNAGNCGGEGFAGWKGALAASGQKTVTGINPNGTFFIGCDPGDGSIPVVESAMARAGNLLTSLQLTADKMVLPAGGGSVNLTWNEAVMSSCTAYGHPNWTGDKTVAGTLEQAPHQATVAGITETTTLGISCISTHDNDRLVDTVKIVVDKTPGAPSVSFYPSLEGVGLGGSTTLNWEATGATTCVASGGWSGTKNAQGGSEPTGAISVPTVYKIACQNASGTTAVSFPIAVEKYPIQLDFTSNPTTVKPGGQAYLMWSTKNLMGCYAAGGTFTGVKAASDSVLVTPTATTTYTLVCSGDYGTAVSKVTINVDGTAAGPTPTPNPGTSTPPTASGAPDLTKMSPCNRIRSAAELPQNPNYAPPYDVVRGTGGLLFNVMCGTEGENVTAIAGTDNPQDYVYDQGYVFRDNQWNQMQFYRMSPTVQPIETHWYNTKISSSFQMQNGKLASDSVVLAYICQWDQGKWKCGCRDAACAAPKWNVQVFQRS